MSPAKRRELVDRQHQTLSIVRQCALLGVGRSSLYYRPKETSQQGLSLIDGPPVPGNPFLRIQADEGIAGAARHLSRKRVQRLMRVMGPSWQPRTKPAPERRVYPYLLRDLPPGPTRYGRPTSPTCGPGVPLLGRDHGLAQPVLVTWRLSTLWRPPFVPRR